MNPSTAISIEAHRTKIEQCKLQAFDNHVPNMISFIEKHYKIIKDNGFDYADETYRRHVIQALSSGPNAAFNEYIRTVQRDVDSGHGFNSKITTAQLFLGARTIYNNLESRGEWDAVDPRDVKIMALTTEIEKLKASATQPSANPSTASTNRDSSSDKVAGVDKWRTVKQGDTLVRNGQTYTWCPHHKHPRGLHHGLHYSNHTPANHNEWKAQRPAPKTDSAAKNSSSAPPSDAKKLEISSTLKSALATNLCISEDDINGVIASLNQAN